MAAAAKRVGRARIVAAVVRKGRIISIGQNKMVTHPIMLKFGTNPEKVYLHAEADAIVKAKDQVEGADIVIVRAIYVDGKLHSGMVKPCECCQGIIAHSGIKNVYWTGG